MKILIIFLLLSSFLFADENGVTATPPYTNELNQASDTTSLSWLRNNATFTWHPTGGYDGNGYVKITPPSTFGPSVNGTYAAIGVFNHMNTPIMNFRMVMNFGTTMHQNSADAGGGRVIKFLDNHASNGSRTGLCSIQYDIIGGQTYEPCLYNTSQDQYYYSDGTTIPTGVDSFHFDDGIGARDYAGEWFCIEYIVTQDSAILYLWTQDGEYEGLYFKIAHGISVNVNRIYSAYHNGYYTNQDANTYIKYDAIRITGTRDVIGPPANFFRNRPSIPQNTNVEPIPSGKKRK